MFRRRLPPLWFQAALTALCCLLWRAALDWAGVPRTAGDGPQLAFWGLVAALAGWIWRGIEVAGRVTLAALSWSVHYLWLFARGAAEVFKAFGEAAVQGFRAAYRGLRFLYREILEPAWRKFWDFVKWAQRTLHRIFDPVLSVLARIRRAILDFYAFYVRPVLDLIDVGRRVLRVLATFGVDWARALDARLAQLQDRIQRPIQILLAKVNEIVNVIDRVVTLDGLLQRFALVRSIERDLREIHRALSNWRYHPLTPADFERVNKRIAEDTPASLVRYIEAAVSEGGGPNGGLRDELVAEFERTMARV